jgi:hypothetical protein
MQEKLEVRKSSIYGKGCFTLVPFQRRKKIAAYAGELLRGKRRIHRRLEAQSAPKIISINEEIAIDGAAGGDETAYINHSCEPNAYMRAGPGNKVLFFALRDIAAGEELTINYRDPEHPEICRCGAQNCRSNRETMNDQ